MPRSDRREGLSRRHRFSERGSFGPVLRSPRKLRGRYAVIHVSSGRDAASRLGIALTRRLVRSAVHRNQIKRSVREAFRRHPVKEAGVDCVVTLRERYQPQDRRAIVAEVRGLFDRIAPAAPQ